MKKTIILLALFVASTSFAWTVSWDPVTTYTDNTLIEASKLPVMYNIRKDGVLIGTRVLGSSLQFTDIGHGLTRSFTAQAELNSGEVSAISPPYSWIVPLGVPINPQNLRVAP